MAFQDFEHLSERRKAERQQKLRKRVTIAAITSTVLVVLIVGAFAFVHISQFRAIEVGERQHPTKEVSHSVNAIKLICSPTDYKEACEKSLLKATQSNPSLSQPRELVKAAISVVLDEVQKAFNRTSSIFKFKNPEEKAAFEDCKVLMQDAREELEDSISRIGDGHNKLSQDSNDLNNWLSAVMSYQQTCIDGFPKGELKSRIEQAFKSAKEFTSNALAIVTKVSSILSLFQVSSNRHLLATHEAFMDRDGIPRWANPEDRRMLKANKENLKPNVVVAKDGSGNFKAISQALAAMPEKHQGRYIIYVKEGVYEETVTVTKKMVNVTMYGDGSRKTIVTGSKNFVDGVRTFQTATFGVLLGKCTTV